MAKTFAGNFLLFPYSYYNVFIQSRTGTERGSAKYNTSAEVAVRAKVHNNQEKRQRAETLSAERQLMKLENGVSVSYLNFATNTIQTAYAAKIGKAKVYKRMTCDSCFLYFAKVSEHWEQTEKIADKGTLKEQQNKGRSGW